MFKSIALIIAMTATAQADDKTMVLRTRANVYAIPGQGFVYTNSCTVTADGTLSARVVHGKKPWIYFYDSDGRREADCQVIVTSTGVKSTKTTRVMVAGTE